MTRSKDKDDCTKNIDLSHTTTRRGKTNAKRKVKAYHRAAGKIVTPKKGEKRMAKGSSKGSGSGHARDAGSGQYVKKTYADTHPKTTVIEHDKAKRK